MKKLLGISLLVLAMLLPASYYATGLLSERIITNNIGALNQSSVTNIVIKNYHRGWLKSSVEMHLVISKPQTNGSSNSVYELDVPVVLWHGPIIIKNNNIEFGLANADIKVELPKDVQQKFTSVFTKNSIKPVIDFQINVNFLGKCHFLTNVPEFYLAKSDGSASLKWLGMNNEVLSSSAMQHVLGKFQLDGFEFKKINTQISVRNIQGNYDLNQTKNGLFLGKAELGLQSAVSKDADNILFSVSDLNVKSDNDAKSGLFNSDFSMEFATIIIDNYSFDSGKIKFKIKNLNEAVLAKINKKLDNLQAAKTDDEKQQIIFSLLPDLPTLLNHGAELIIPQFEMHLVDGMLSGAMNLKIPDANNLNWFEIIHKTEGAFHLQIPRGALNKLMDVVAGYDTKATTSGAEKLSAIVKAGGLIETENSYILDLGLAHGNINVNGKAASPELLKLL
jgi:uncharacterized protein YdgA (DUF945 family)